MNDLIRDETKRTVRRLDLIRGILILTLVLYIAVTLIINSEYLTADRLLRLRSDVFRALRSAPEKVAKLDDETLDVQLFQDGFVILSRNGISVCSSSGSEYAFHSLRYREPRIKISGQYILCFDRGGNDWCLLNTFRDLCSGTTEEPIVFGVVSSDGYFAVAAEKFEYKGCLTVYNSDGTPLALWNADTYLIDAFFLSRSEVAMVSLASREEKAATVFSVLNYRTGETAVAAETEGIPYAMAQKSGGDVELLVGGGSWIFDGSGVSAAYAFRNASPGLCCQGREMTLVAYPDASGVSTVDAFSPSGNVLFTVQYPALRCMACSRDNAFLLTADRLYVLDSSGSVVWEREASAREVLASPEISLLRNAEDVEPLDLSQIP